MKECRKKFDRVQEQTIQFKNVKKWILGVALPNYFSLGPSL